MQIPCLQGLHSIIFVTDPPGAAERSFNGRLYWNFGLSINSLPKINVFLLNFWREIRLWTFVNWVWTESLAHLKFCEGLVRKPYLLQRHYLGFLYMRWRWCTAFRDHFPIKSSRFLWGGAPHLAFAWSISVPRLKPGIVEYLRISEVTSANHCTAFCTLISLCAP